MDVTFNGGVKSWADEVVGTEKVSEIVKIPETSIKQHLEDSKFYIQV